MPMINVNGAELHYECHGQGPPLVLIHGLGSCGQDWGAQIQAFSGRYTVVTVDMRGHGQSEKAAGAYSMELFARDVAAVLDELQTRPAHIVGISMGGAIAFQLAVDRPDLLKSMVIVNSGPYVILETLAQKSIIWVRLAMIYTLGLPALGRMVAKKLFPGTEHDTVRNEFIKRFKQNDRRAYVKSLRALVGWSVKQRLNEVQVPVLVISADQDYTPVEMKEAYLPLIADARLVVIPDSRHAVPMERPEAFNRSLDEFLAAVR